MKKEVLFSELEKASLMAKSTLNDHLHGLLSEKAVRKAIGRTPDHMNRPVYVVTAKGRRIYESRMGRFKWNLEHYV